MNGSHATKILIGLDLDGVIIDHTENRIRAAAELGYALMPSEAGAGAVKQKLPLEVHRAIQKNIYADPKAALRAPFVAGAEEGIHALRDAGASLVLISRRQPSELAVQLLAARGLWPSVFNETNAFFVLHKEDKNVKAKELGVHAYLDDEADVLEALLDVPHRFLLDPHGVSAGDEQKYTRLASWDAFVKAVMNFPEAQ